MWLQGVAHYGVEMFSSGALYPTKMQTSRAGGPGTNDYTVCPPDRETCLLHTKGNPPIHFKLVTRQQLSTGNNFWSLPTQTV